MPTSGTGDPGAGVAHGVHPEITVAERRSDDFSGEKEGIRFCHDLSVTRIEIHFKEFFGALCPEKRTVPDL
jgi:hypothetical protein